MIKIYGWRGTLRVLRAETWLTVYRTIANFVKPTGRSLTRVLSSSKAEIHIQLNFNIISSKLIEQNQNPKYKLYQKHKRDNKTHGCSQGPG